MNPVVANTVAASGRRHTWVWVVVGVSAALLAAGVVGGFFAIGNFVRSMAIEPWVMLHEAAQATRTDQGAAAFYRSNPDLSSRYPTAETFVEASRRWRPKLASLPEAVPEVTGLLKQGATLNVNRSNDKVTFSLKNYQGMSVQLSSDQGKLTDLLLD